VAFQVQIAFVLITCEGGERPLLTNVDLDSVDKGPIDDDDDQEQERVLTSAITLVEVQRLSAQFLNSCQLHCLVPSGAGAGL